MPLHPKLLAWTKAAPARKVTQRVESNRCVCECTEGGHVVALGVGDTPEAAVKHACDALWRLALEATSVPSNPAPTWRPRKPKDSQ